MPILPSIKPEDASPEVSATYDEVAEKYGGVVPELYRKLANSPTYLASLNDHMGRVMAPGKVDAETKEVVAFVISAANGCDYCIHAHKQALGQFGFDDEAITELLGVAALWEEVNRFAIGVRLHWGH